MAYHPMMYRLLGVADRGCEPTHYELLGLSPARCTAVDVEHRVNECRKRLRQSIPGPQFIPIIALWEQDLEQAAQALVDPRRRERYDSQRAPKDVSPNRASAAVPERVDPTAVRKTIESAVGSGGTLGDADRSTLADRLREIQVPEESIKSSIAEIPRPLVMVPGVDATTMAFYGRAIDLCLQDGWLLERDYESLLAVAERIGVRRQAAEAAIQQHCAAKGARRVQPSSGPAAVISSAPAPSTAAADVGGRCEAHGGGNDRPDLAGQLHLPPGHLSRTESAWPGDSPVAANHDGGKAWSKTWPAAVVVLSIGIFIGASVFLWMRYQEKTSGPVAPGMPVALAVAPPQSPEQVFQKVAPAVVGLEVIDASGQTFAIGSGFFIDGQGTVETNAHVVESAARVRVHLSDGRTLMAEEIRHLDTALDLAVLRTRPVSASSVLMRSTPPRIGERVFAIGTPKGLQNTMSEGLISGIRTDLGPRGLIQTSAAISGGSSGGPLVDDQGQVVGVVTLGSTGVQQTPSGPQVAQNLNFAVPIGAVRELLARPAILRPLGH